MVAEINSPRLTPRHIGYSIFTGVHRYNDVPAHPVGILAQHVPCYTHRDKLHRHQEHELLLIGRGAGAYRLNDGREIPVSAGQIMVIPSGIVHALTVRDFIAMRGFLIHPDLLRVGDFQHSAPKMSAISGIADPIIINDPTLLQMLSDIFDYSAVEYGTRDGLQSSALVALGKFIAIMLVRAWSQEPQQEIPDAATYRVQIVRAWIDRHFFNEISLPKLAEMAQLSRSQFCVIFDRLYQSSPYAYLRQRRLNQAANLLVDSTMTITEIAANSGFDAPSTFNRAFHAMFGLSPSAYRIKCIADRTKSEATGTTYQA
jgi:AraC-like DNA-binding protein